MDHSTLDTERAARIGHPEIVFGGGKTAEQVADILLELRRHGQFAFATRLSPEKVARIKELLGEDFHSDASSGVGWVGEPPLPVGSVAVVCAGTSDEPVAAEASVVARLLGNHVERVRDVGVAGIHRILGRAEELRRFNVVIVVAGMDGALPSVVGGLVGTPIIAVPTSVGYGASFGGIAALLTMLNSCAPGVTGVNIDNGFGAAYAASRVNQLVVRASAGARP